MPPWRLCLKRGGAESEENSRRKPETSRQHLVTGLWGVADAQGYELEDGAVVRAELGVGYARRGNGWGAGAHLEHVVAIGDVVARLRAGSSSTTGLRQRASRYSISDGPISHGLPEPRRLVCGVR